jgi:glutathione S-transferase
MIDVLEEAVTTSPYLTGDRFTAADVYVGSQMRFAMLSGSIDKRPGLEAYCQRISSRPAAIRAQEIDDALLAQARQKT